MTGLRACILLLLTAFVLASCGDGDRRTENAATARPARPDLRVIAITDLSGYLEPCGCQSRPLGGIDKTSAQIAALRADGTPTLVVAAGDLFFGGVPEGASSATEAQTQETWKAETLARIFTRVGLTAAAPSGRDLVYGQATLESLAKQGKYRLLPAKPNPGDAPEAVDSLKTKLGDLSVGVVGVSTFAAAGAELEPARERELMKQTQARIDALDEEGATWIVVLVSSTQRFGRRIAGGVKNADLVVLGGLEAAEVLPPSRVGDAYVLRAGQQGQHLVVLDLFASGAPTLGVDADTSEWTRRESSKDARARVDELSSKIEAWQRDPSVDKANLAEQRTRLDAMRAELAKLDKKSDVTGSRFEARSIEIGPEIKGDSEVRDLIADYDARVNEHNKVAFADLLPKPAPPSAASYVGSERCKGCHASEFAWWTGHPHGKAYTTLVTRHKEFNLSCVGCHVTGYLQPGGSTITHNEGLTHVGCESCHGPGSKHVASPDDEPAIGMTRDPNADTCKHCHTPEHSDKFDYAKYHALLVVPGHGLPPTAAGTPK